MTALVTEAQIAEMLADEVEPGTPTPSGFRMVAEEILSADRWTTVYRVTFMTPDEKFVQFNYELSNVTFEQVRGREVTPEQVREVTPQFGRTVTFV